MPTGMINGFGMKFTAALQGHPLLCGGGAPGSTRTRREGLRAQARAAGMMPAGERLGSNENLPLRLGVRTIFCVVFLFLLAQSCIVQCFGANFAPISAAHAQAAQKKPAGPKKQQSEPWPAPEIRCGSDPLPGPVADMREAILGAVGSGRIEDLRHAWELNELKPDLGVDLGGGDAIAHWKQISGDGEGREILAALGEILDAGCAVLPLGRDLENNRIYVWPYLAETDLAKLGPAQEVQLLRLVPPAAAKQMRATGKYTHWRLGIGADGTWHFFRRGP
jgi:hypothetical protein